MIESNEFLCDRKFFIVPILIISLSLSCIVVVTSSLWISLPKLPSLSINSTTIHNATMIGRDTISFNMDVKLFVKNPNHHTLSFRDVKATTLCRARTSMSYSNNNNVIVTPFEIPAKSLFTQLHADFESMLVHGFDVWDIYTDNGIANLNVKLTGLATYEGKTWLKTSKFSVSCDGLVESFASTTASFGSNYCEVEGLWGHIMEEIILYFVVAILVASFVICMCLLLWTGTMFA